MLPEECICDLEIISMTEINQHVSSLVPFPESKFTDHSSPDSRSLAYLTYLSIEVAHDNHNVGAIRTVQDRLQFIVEHVNGFIDGVSCWRIDLTY